MPAADTKYQQKGNKVLTWLTAAPANLAAPTQAELGAGVDITCEIDPQGIEGFTTSVSTLSTPTLCSTFEEEIADTETPDSSSLTFYKKWGSTTIWDLFVKGNTGYLVVAPETNATGAPTEVTQVEVLNRTWLNTPGASKFRVAFAVKAVPSQGVAAA